MFDRVRLATVALGAVLLVGCGSTAAGGGTPGLGTHGASVAATGTPRPTAYPTSSVPIDVTVTGPEAMTVSAFSTDPTDQYCVTGQLDGVPVFDVTALIGAASRDVGDILEVEISAQAGQSGPIYAGPGTYQIDYSAQPDSGAYDMVVINQTSGAVALQMWKGSITVNSDQSSASFTGTYGTQGPAGWSSDGTISGSVACVPGAPS